MCKLHLSVSKDPTPAQLNTQFMLIVEYEQIFIIEDFIVSVKGSQLLISTNNSKVFGIHISIIDRHII